MREPTAVLTAATSFPRPTSTTCCERSAIFGIVTDQCIDGAARSACDLGYLVTKVTDACTIYTKERRDFTQRAIKSYYRQRTTAEFLREIGMG